MYLKSFRTCGGTRRAATSSAACSGAIFPLRCTTLFRPLCGRGCRSATTPTPRLGTRSPLLHLRGSSRVVELVALRRAAPRAAAQFSRCVARHLFPRFAGGVVAARQPPPHGSEHVRRFCISVVPVVWWNSSRCDE